MNSSKQPHVVIVGGGFGGLQAAKALGKAPVRVTVIDRQNYHLFQPLLYQVATAALSPGEIAWPIRSVLHRHPNVHVWMGEVVAVDPERKTVILADGEVPYDFLIVAAGARHAYFGRDEWEPLAPGLKSLDDALEIRRRVLLAFERAEKEPDREERNALLTFAVVGGGPTGVELAGALAEIARHTLVRDFRQIDPSQARVLLLEAGPRILPTFHPSLSEKAVASLVKLGVEVRTGAAVTEIRQGEMEVGGERIRAQTVLWAAGVAASPLAKSLGAPLDRVGRVVVEPDLTLPGRPEVYVVGDLASFRLPNGGTLPGLAPVAMQEGRWAAENIARTLRGEPRLPFSYRDRGVMATIGRAAGIAERGRLRLSGVFGWLAWLFIHLLFLIGFKNRAVVLFLWTWSYLTYKRGARLITGVTAFPPDPVDRVRRSA